jgi:ABC-type bacteriocin/lantibiotic exporter with double-glycine peptidase domain
MLLDRYSINASEGEMAYRAATSFLGTDAHSMVRALREKVSENGYQVRTRRVDYEECIRRGEPFLAHVRGANFGHAVLVERVSSEMATIVDPVDGLLHRLPRKEFEGIWDGTVIEIVPSAE